MHLSRSQSVCSQQRVLDDSRRDVTQPQPGVFAHKSLHAGGPTFFRNILLMFAALPLFVHSAFSLETQTGVQDLHVPGLAPSRYSSALQTMFGMGVHLNPLLVPLQEPERCWPAGHLMRAQTLHLNPLLAPLHEPDRYWLVGQEVRAQVLQLVAVFVPALYLPDWQALHEVPERYLPSPQRTVGGGGGAGTGPQWNVL